MSTPSPLQPWPQRWRHGLALRLERWALALRATTPVSPDGPPATAAKAPARAAATGATATDAADAPEDRVDPAEQCPASRQPLSLEHAVQQRSLVLLQREAADALAALAGAHALVSSARFSQLQELRHQVTSGAMPQDTLQALAADYQGWHSDQVRLFDALALVLRMRIPRGKALDQVGANLQEQCLQHLASLSADYQRGLLERQLQQPAARAGDATDRSGSRASDADPEPDPDGDGDAGGAAEDGDANR